MERFDLTARLWEKPGSSYDTIKRALGKLSGQILPGRLSRKCRCSGRPCTCGARKAPWHGKMAATRTNPYAMYTPGRYIRGC